MDAKIYDDNPVHRISGKYDAVVVGAGIMGSSSAYQLAKQGLSVILIEQFDFLHHRGSSHGESRIIRPTYPEDYYTEMMIRAYQLWTEAEAEAGYSVFTKTGGLDFGPSSNPDLLAVLAACKKHNVPHDILNSHEIEERFGIHANENDIGIYNTEAGILNSTKACSMFQQLARQHGAVLRDRSSVTEISPNYSDDAYKIRVKTSAGSLEASHCVVAAGAWTSKLIQNVSGNALPIQPLHTGVAYWRVFNRDKFSVSNRFPVFINYDEPCIYGFPVNEFPGLMKVCLHSGPKCDPDKREMLPELSLVKSQLSPWMNKTFKSEVDSVSPVLTEACMYSMTPDQDFILDFVNLLPVDEGSTRVLVLGGFSGHGFKMSPLIGKIAADMVLHGSSAEVDMSIFSIERFKASQEGNKKSISPQVNIHD